MSNAHATPVVVHGPGQSKPLAPIRIGEAKGSFDEAWLQDLIHRNPCCLPVEEIEPGFVPLVSICKELPTNHGPIDNLLMTADGNIVVAEVKLWRNPEARRRVIAQALDYASCLFEMDYEAFERAVLKGDFGHKGRPKRLYDLFSESTNAPTEARFIDTVARNLRKGQVLILVVGDGIRAEAAKLGSLVQSHAGAHFTFALVELPVFQIPETDNFLVCPRTLVQTEMIERGVVQIDDTRFRIVAPESKAEPKKARESITAEQFFEAMAQIRQDIPDKLRAFIADVEPLGVYPDFRRTLILRWDAPDGTPINLGHITTAGQVWTNASNWKVSHEISHRYNEELAELWGVEVQKDSGPGEWHIAIDGKAPRIDQIVDMLDRWPAAIKRFQARLKG